MVCLWSWLHCHHAACCRRELYGAAALTTAVRWTGSLAPSHTPVHHDEPVPALAPQTTLWRGCPSHHTVHTALHSTCSLCLLQHNKHNIQHSAHQPPNALTAAQYMFTSSAIFTSQVEAKVDTCNSHFAPGTIIAKPMLLGPQCAMQILSRSSNPQSSHCPGCQSPPSTMLLGGHVCLPAKWHLIPSNGWAAVCTSVTDRQR